jgi:hypothetical protein
MTEEYLEANGNEQRQKVTELKKLPRPNMKLDGAREGKIKPDKAFKEGFRKYIDYQSHIDRYQVQFASGRQYEDLSNYQERSHYKPSKDPLKHKEGDWWVAGVPAIPYAQILNEQPVTNLFEPGKLELRDINKMQSLPYGRIMSKNKFIQESIKTMDRDQTHYMLAGVRPYERNVMRDYIYSQRNEIPHFKFENIYNKQNVDSGAVRYGSIKMDKAALGKGKNAYKR